MHTTNLPKGGEEESKSELSGFYYWFESQTQTASASAWQFQVASRHKQHTKKGGEINLLFYLYTFINSIIPPKWGILLETRRKLE